MLTGGDRYYSEKLKSEEICSGIVKAGDVVERRRAGAFTEEPADFCQRNQRGHRTSDGWDNNCVLDVELAS